MNDLTYQDLCILSQRFNASTNLQIDYDYKINEALKSALRKASRLTNVIINLDDAISGDL